MLFLHAVEAAVRVHHVTEISGPLKGVTEPGRGLFLSTFSLSPSVTAVFPFKSCCGSSLLKQYKLKSKWLGEKAMNT